MFVRTSTVVAISNNISSSCSSRRLSSILVAAIHDTSLRRQRRHARGRAS